jgi:hypothetical protein
MRKSTLPAALETSSTCDQLSGQLHQRVGELLAAVAAFHAEPVTPTSTFALEKKSRPFCAMPAAMSSTAP